MIRVAAAGVVAGQVAVWERSKVLNVTPGR